MTYQGTKLPNFDPRGKVTELEIIDTEIGTGEEVKPGAKIKAHYTGALVKNGIIFQSSHDFGEAIWSRSSDRWLDAGCAWDESWRDAAADYSVRHGLWQRAGEQRYSAK